MFKHGGEEKQRFSIRKYSTGVFSSLVGVALLMLASAQDVLADHKLIYDHVDINDLSEADKAQIRTGIPSGRISADEEIILVYRGVERQVPPPHTPEDPKKPKTPEDPKKPKTPENPETPETPENPDIPKTPEDSEKPKTPTTPLKNQKVFPNTGQEQTNLLLELGLAGLALGAAVYLRRSKNGRYTFLVVTILGTTVLGSHLVVADGYKSLINQVTQIVQDDAEISNFFTPTTIPNYKYVGYIRRQRPATPTPDKKGTVNVHYRDKNGNMIAPMAKAVTDGKVGSPYSTKSLFRQTIEKDGKNYKWVETRGVEEGKLSEGVTNVTYIYELETPAQPPIVKKGSVVVKYTNTAGQEIKASETVLTDQPVGTAYDVTDKKEDTLTGSDGKTYHYKSTTGNPTGSVVEGITEVTYVYEENTTPPPVIPPVVKKGSVVVKYVSESGQELKASETVLSDQPVDTAYDVTDKKEPTLTGPDGKTYHYKSTIGNPTGSVVEGTTEVTYVYEESVTPPPVIPPVVKKGSVVVKYVNTAGQELKTSISAVSDASVGTAYDVSSLRDESITVDGKTYNYVSTSGSETGSVVEGTTEVTYVYEESTTPPPVIPPAVKQGSVVVRYQSSTGEEIKSSVTAVANAEVGTPYNTSALRDEEITVNGKTYRYVSTSGIESGSVVEGITEVTYVYEESVTPPPVIPPVVKKGSVVVKYVNESGQELKASETVLSDQPVGTAYDVTGKKEATLTGSDGKVYRYKSTTGNPTGSVVEGTTEVTYVYEESVTPPPVTPPVVKKGSVVVKYINESGQELKASETVLSDQPVGTAYDVTGKKEATLTGPDGKVYRYKSTTGNPTGSVVEGTTEVTYVYEESVTPPPVIPPVVKKGSVVVKYVNESGQELKASETVLSDQPVGTAYDVTGKKEATLTGTDGKAYRYKSTTGNPTGSVVEGTTEVTYVYEESVTPPPVIPPVVKKGSVRVHYKTTSGEELKPMYKAVEDAEVGTSYDVRLLREETIEKDGKTYRYKSTIGAEQGTVEEGATDVTYVYEKLSVPPVIQAKGTVTVKFESINHETLKAPETVLENVPVDTAYDVRDRRRQTLTVGGKTYRYVSVQGSETGNVVEGNTEIVYLYEEVVAPPVVKKGSVVVKYTNESGQEIKASETVMSEEPVGTAYDVTGKKEATLTGTDGKAYRYKSTTGNPTGSVVEGTTEVTYVYEEVVAPPVVKTGSVVVKYTNESGQEIKASETVMSEEPVGTAYDVTGKKLETLTGTDGKAYRYKSTTGNPTGSVVEGTTEVTYVYEEVVAPPVVKKGSVVVKYVNESGQEIKASETAMSEEPVGTTYDVTGKKESTLTGTDGKAYRYKSTTGNPTGSVVEGTTEVTYVYEEVVAPPVVKTGSVVVKYTNESGQELKASETVMSEEPVGTAYDVTGKKLETLTGTDGKAYRYKSTTGNPTGSVVEGTTEVTYVYEEVVAPPVVKTGSVVVKYVNESGQELKSSETVMSEEPVGTAYDVTDKKEATLTDTDGKTYRYKSTTGNPTGSVVEGTTEVTYVYEEVVAPPVVKTGSVVVKYVNESGQEIKASETVMSEEPVGTAYDVTGKKESTLTGTDGKAYRYKSTTGNPTGSVVEGTTEVTYVYEEVVAPPVVKTGSVVVKYVNESGQELKSSETVMSEEPVGTAYDVTGKKESTLTGPDGKAYRYKSTTGNPTGSVVEGTTEVTYVYEEVVAPPVVKTGSVVVKYVNESGQELKSSETVMSEEPVGTAYDVTDKKEATLTDTDGKTYRYKSTTGNPTGSVVEGTTTITYVYELVPEVKRGTVIVRYITFNNGRIQDIKDPETVVDNEPVGTPFNVTAKKLDTLTGTDGYNYRYESTMGYPTGVVSNGTTHVTFVYERVKGSVKVRYVSKKTGEQLAPEAEVLPAGTPAGTTYDLAAYRKDPSEFRTGIAQPPTYETVEVDKPETGVVEDSDTVITYAYDYQVKNPAQPTEIKGSVVVKYVNESGQEIKASETVMSEESVGTAYDVTGKKLETLTGTDGKSYRYKSTTGNPTGSVVEGTTEVTYVYEEVKGSVVVKYVNESGQEIKASETVMSEEPVGTAYDVTGKKLETLTGADGKAYRYKSTTGNPTGSVVEGTTEVTYVYEEVKGSVVVKYVNESGQEIKASETVMSEEPVGTAYDVTGKKEATLTGTDGKAYRYKSTTGNPTGSVVEGTTEVTYVYEEVKGSVVVKYVNESGQEIKASETVMSEEPVGTAYDVTGKKEATLTGTDGKAYRYKSTTGNPTGSVVEGTTEVTYVYEEVKGSVVVKYVNESGQEIKASETVMSEEPVGTAYDVTGKKEATLTGTDGKAYRYKSTTGNPTGSVVEGTTEVTYVYEEVKGSVVVKYVNESGQEIKASETVMSEEPVGTAYDVTGKKESTLTGTDGKAYRYKSTTGNPTGSVVEGTTEVTYIYEEVKGSVVVKYVNESGQEIKASETVMSEEPVGTAYDVTGKKLETLTGADGKAYRYKSTTGNPTGSVVEGTTEVTYVYEEVKGSVVVKYVNESGQEIKASETVMSEEPVGTAYDVTGKKLETLTGADGKAYRYKSTTGNPTGSVVEGTTEVTYVYEEVKGSVVVKYVNESGQEIKASETVMSEEPVGTAYDVTGKKEATLTGTDGKAYRYKSTTGNPTGSVVEGTTEVTYVYEEVKGSVVVKYVNESGQEIKASETVMSEEPVGTAYDVTGKKEATLTGTDGKAYRYKSTTGNPTGSVVEGTTEVTYVYEEVKGSVVVKYVNESGQEIKASETVMSEEPVGTAYDVTGKKEATLTGTDGKAYRYKSTTGNPTGSVVEGTTEVTYVYEEVKGSVVVKYVNESGQEIKASETVMSEEPVGTAYDVTGKKEATLTGTDGKAYRYKSTTGNPTGSVVEGTTEVTYVYEEVKGSVVVKYVNESGQEIKASETVMSEEPVGTAYDVTGKKESTLTGTDGKAYRYKSTTGNPTGSVVEGTTEVTYVYEEVKGSVVVKYVNESGQEIKASETVMSEEPVGTAYDVTGKKLETLTGTDGKAYRYKSTTGNPTGSVAEGTTEITYVYEEVKGSVVVKYVNESGQDLKAPERVMNDQPVGTAYDVTGKKEATLTDTDGKTYRYKSTTGNPTGSVVEGTTTITYVYELVPEVKRGTVIVRYITFNNGRIQDIKNPETVVDNEPVGTPFNVTGKKLDTLIGTDGYNYRYESTMGYPTGVVSNGTTHVTFVYEKVKGSVVVKYVNESGQDLKAPERVMNDQPVGTVYDVTAKKEATLTDTDGKTYRYKSTTGNPTGSVVEGTTTITYVYELVPEVKRGTVIVRYITFNNGRIQDIKDPETVVDNEPVGTPFNVTAKKLDTLTGTDGYNYRYESTMGYPTGVVSNGTTHVTFVYEKVKGSVVVKYVNESGQDLKAPERVMNDQPVGTVYDVTAKKEATLTDTDGKTYRYKSTTGNPTGSVVEGTTTITYVYELVPEVKRGTVIVRYITFNNGRIQDIKDPETVVDNEPVGTPFNVTGKKLDTLTGTDGYNYRYESTMGYPTGVVSNGTTHVTFVYERVKGSVKVRYVSKKTGEQLAPEAEVLPAGTPAGTTYDLAAYRKDPSEFRTGIAQPPTYETVEVDKPETGVVEDSDTVITYTYDYQLKNPAQPTETKGSVVVKYVNESGQEIKASETVMSEEPVGTAYDVTGKKLETLTGTDGKAYRYKSTTGNPTGSVVEGTTEITYVYEEVKGSVVVKYVNESGQEIKASETVMSEEPVGTAYDVTGKKLETLTGTDGKAYRYKSTTGNPTGSVVEGTTEVTYVYEEAAEPVKEGSVIVRHIAYIYGEGEKEILPQETVLPDGPTGREYDASSYRRNSIISNGKAYAYDRVEGNVTGRSGKGVTYINFIYRKVSAVTVRYISQKTGRELAPSVVIAPAQNGAYSTLAYKKSPSEFSTGLANPSTYQTVRVDGHENGAIDRGDVTVTYYYDYDETPRPENQGSYAVDYTFALSLQSEEPIGYALLSNFNSMTASYKGQPMKVEALGDYYASYALISGRVFTGEGKNGEEIKNAPTLEEIIQNIDIVFDGQTFHGIEAFKNHIKNIRSRWISIDKNSEVYQTNASTYTPATHYLNDKIVQLYQTYDYQIKTLLGPGSR